MTEEDLRRAIAERGYRHKKTRKSGGGRKKKISDETYTKMFRTRVKEAKVIKAKRKKYTGLNESVGFAVKIPRSEQIKKIEKKSKVRYGGSNYWYV